MYKLFDIPQFSDERGELFCLDGEKLNINDETVDIDGKEFPFDIRRCFWIKNVPAGQKRGAHAHRTCGEIIIAANGNFVVDVTNGSQKATISLCDSHTALYIPPYTWCELHSFSPDAVCLCLASQSYIAEGYINNFNEYLQTVAKRN